MIYRDLTLDGQPCAHAALWEATLTKRNRLKQIKMEIGR